jgi:hypothetical protein
MAIPGCMTGKGMVKAPDEEVPIAPDLRRIAPITAHLWKLGTEVATHTKIWSGKSAHSFDLSTIFIPSRLGVLSFVSGGNEIKFCERCDMNFQQ